ncbi:hypothetical protein [Algibacter aquimarinus]|uniref:DUF4136 domain-containing protein n=1 Tax=Algibacter aquimarinus TaxID=1136748 RepID=A0ABP9HMU7_9FLAO
MFKKVLFISFCLLSVFSFSQNRKPHVIKLLPNKDAPVKAVDFYVSEVLDNRIYKDNIGIAQKGIFNKKVLSVFSKPFEEEILNYLNSVFPQKSEKQSVTIRINQLLISENTGAFKETGKATINLDVLQKIDDDYFLLGSYSAYREKNSADVTGKHDDRIRSILSDCMQQFQFHFKFEKENINPRLISIKTKAKPAIFDEDIKEGFFKTFNELYNNTPFLDNSIKFKNKENRLDKLYLSDIDHKRALYYAYHDGEYIFLNASSFSGEKHFVKTETVDRFLLFNDAFVNQDDAIGMSMAFGVLGILASNRKSHVLLDLYTGQFHILKENKIKVLLRNHRELYEVYKKSRDDISVMKDILETLFNKEEVAELRMALKS